LVNLAERLGDSKAEVKTIIGYAKSHKDIRLFEGIIKGTIVREKGQTGFGWDPIFMPDGYAKTFAEMTQVEKNNISMRKIAVEQLKKFLRNNKR
jgi:XTP/dITP diphosphohydrolase